MLAGIAKYHVYVNKAIVAAATKAQHRQHRLGAVLVKGASIRAIGWNRSFKHAEHMAIDRAHRLDLRNAMVIVVRLRKDGTLAMARPCETCQNILILAGIKKVFFSNDDGKIEEMRLDGDPNDLKDVHTQYHYMRPDYSR